MSGPVSVSVLVADSQELIRAGIRSMLAGTGIEIIGDAADAKSTLALVKKQRPDVLLLDVGIRGGSAFAMVAKPLVTSKVVIVIPECNANYVAKSRKAGAANCLVRDFSREALVRAIDDAAAGRSIAGQFHGVGLAAADRMQDPAFDAGLTTREAEVLSSMAAGLSNDEIARSLGVSLQTVKTHVKAILCKLAVDDRTQAALWAVRAGLA